MRPRRFKRPAAYGHVSVLPHQPHQLFPRSRRHRHNRNLRSLSRRKRQPLPHHKHRIQHIAVRLPQCQQRRSPRPPSAQAVRPVRFELKQTLAARTQHHHLRHINRFVLRRPQPPPSQKRLQLRSRLCLNEHLAERRMRPVRLMHRQAQLRHARHGNLPPPRPLVHERHPANLHIVLRRYRHVHVALNSQLQPVILGPVRAEGRRVPRVLHVQWLMRRRPKRVALLLVKVNKGPPVVPRRVRPPTSNLKFPPPAVPTARIRHHQRIPPVSQQMHPRNRRVLVKHPILRHQWLRRQPRRHVVRGPMD